ncbi:type II secretion system protein GspK [Oligoflexia bacterium]|nr:type II secretion system protein GspK [Oligoflexia bacterium]
MNNPGGSTLRHRTGHQIDSDAHAKGEEGVAIILVILVISLASILVVNLTYTASLEARSNLVVERGLKAEYLLKSAVSFAQALIRADVTPDVDGVQDVWAQFHEGSVIPLSLLGIDDPALTIEVEIRPVESKIPLRQLATNKKWRDILSRLFQKLGFDDDKEEDQTGLLSGRILKSHDLVAALIDYMDHDNKSFRSDDFPGIGIEESLPEGTFPNENIRRIAELSSIPGFTPARIRLLTPFVRGARGGTTININLAPAIVLRSLDEDLDEGQVQQIDDFRRSAEGPFGEKGAKLKEDLNELIGKDLADKISWALDSDSRYFQVIAKVDYGTSTYFMRAYLSQRRDTQLPNIQSVELF